MWQHDVWWWRWRWWCSACLEWNWDFNDALKVISAWLSVWLPLSIDLPPVTSHLLGWWWWWRRRTASSWAPAATRRSAPRSRMCSWCGPAGRPPSPWCSGGPRISAGSGRCSGKAHKSGSRRCCRYRWPRGSVCRGRWRWCPCARRCPPASSSPGWLRSRWWRRSRFGELKEDLLDRAEAKRRCKEEVIGRQESSHWRNGKREMLYNI